MTPIPAGTIRHPTPSTPQGLRVIGVAPGRLDATPLHLAAAAGHREAVATLLAAANPAALDYGDLTPLHLALLNGHDDVAHLLVDGGAPLNARPSNSPTLERGILESWPPLFHPSPAKTRPVQGAGTALSLVYEARRNRDLFEKLLVAGADPRIGPNGALVSRAASLGRRDEVERFLALDPFATDHFGRTAFTAALHARRFALARELRERRFDPSHPLWPDDVKVPLAARALESAIAVKDDETIEWIIERFPERALPALRPPLVKAIHNGDAVTVRHLLRAGADPSTRVDGYRISDDVLRRLTALVPDFASLLPRPGRAPKAIAPSAATETSAPPRLRFPGIARSRGELYSPPPDAPLPARTPEGQRADARLFAAAATGDFAMLQSALASGASAAAEDRDGWTPLLHALRANQIEIARTLVDHNAPLNRLAPNGISPLAFAGNFTDLVLMQEFLDLGADPNLVDPERAHGSALVLLMGRNPAAFQLLLERGADPRVVASTHDRSAILPPIFFAAARGDLASVKLLSEFGADPTSVLWSSGDAGWGRGHSAVQAAAASNDLATLEHFLSLGLDPALPDPAGRNALDHALQARADRTAAKLQALGVTPRAATNPPRR